MSIHSPVTEQMAQAMQSLELEERALLEKARTYQYDMARIAVDMDEADRFVTRKGDVLGHLNELQVRAQKKNKAMYEELLTNLVQDVMPGKVERVVLSTSMKNNRASLDFDVIIDGKLMNIVEDKGGAIANIVAMGLRFIVLARHPNRRILLLDEADCHVSHLYSPSFAAVMHQLALKMGIQVLYISHKKPDNFLGHGRVLRIYNHEGKTHCQVVHEESTEDREIDATNAFRYLRLKDFGPHENLYVELAPGLNVITGDNDVGKSKILQAVIELLANNGKESRIRADRPSFSVEIGLEEGMSLHWQYHRKGAKKTLMELKSAEGEILESSNVGTDAPEWLDAYLAMPLVNGENIHYQSQQQVNYLLSDTEYTSIKRFEMLPLGRESRDVQRMITLFNERLLEARVSVRTLSKQMTSVKNMLAIVAPVLDDPFDFDELHREFDAVRDRLAKKDQMLEVSKRLSQLETIHAELTSMLANPNTQAPSPVELKAPQEGLSIIEELTRLEGMSAALAELELVMEAPMTPELHDLSKLKEFGARIAALGQLQGMLASVHELTQPEPVNLHDLGEMATVIGGLETLSAKQTQHAEKMKSCQAEGERLVASKKAIYEKMGGICPTCNNPLEGHAHA